MHCFFEVKGALASPSPPSGSATEGGNRQGQRLLQDQEMTVYNIPFHRFFIGLSIRLYVHMSLSDE